MTRNKSLASSLWSSPARLTLPVLVFSMRITLVTNTPCPLASAATTITTSHT